MNSPHFAISLSEWQSARPGSEPSGCPALAGLVLADPVTRNLARRLADARVVQVEEFHDGLAIRTFSHVGRIVLGNVEITIRPKLERLPLLQLLRYAYQLSDLSLHESAGYGTATGVFVDLLIQQLAAEATELLKRGVHRNYVSRSDMLSMPRGRIDMRELVRRGGVVTAELPCVHYPRSPDVLANQVLLAGLRLSASLTDDPTLRTTVRRLAAVLGEEANPISLSSAAFARVRREANRLITAYQPALALVELLASGRTLTLEHSGTSVTLPGFLLDMNRLWQAVLLKFLRDNLKGFDVRDEQQLRDVVAYVPGKNPRGRPAPRPRPDFVVLEGSTMRAILDAKYIDLWDGALGRDVLYQLALYASTGEARTATMLYPTTSPVAREEWLDVCNPTRGERLARVIARPVPVDRLADLVDPTTSSASERMTFAHELAFGA